MGESARLHIQVTFPISQEVHMQNTPQRKLPTARHGWVTPQGWGVTSCNFYEVNPTALRDVNMNNAKRNAGNTCCGPTASKARVTQERSAHFITFPASAQTPESPRRGALARANGARHSRPAGSHRVRVATRIGLNKAPVSEAGQSPRASTVAGRALIPASVVRAVPLTWHGDESSPVQIGGR